MLRVVNVNIGVVCVVLFFSVVLISNVGIVSSEFLGLFESGLGIWMIVLLLNLLIFNSGVLQVQVDVVEIEQKICVVCYEYVIQVVFQEVVDGLVVC